MNKSSPALASLVCSILAWGGLGLMFFGSRSWPDFFFLHETGVAGWPALPLLLLIVLTTVLWLIGIVGGVVALVMLSRDGRDYGRDRTRFTVMAWTAVILGSMPPALFWPIRAAVWPIRSCILQETSSLGNIKDWRTALSRSSSTGRNCRSLDK